MAQRLLRLGSISCSHRGVRILNCGLLLGNAILIYLVFHGFLFLPAPESYFYRPITAGQRQRMLSILRDFNSFMEAHNISYLMGAGTLLGSYRHHGPVPWDDDVDVFVLEEDRERLRAALASSLPSNMSRYRAFYGDLGAPAWKFYDSSSPDWFIQHSFRWPYIDIFFLSGNATHVWHESLSPKPRLRERLFPLVRRPFADLWLPAPCDTEYVLDFINMNDCQNRAFSHLIGFSMPLWRQHRVACSSLRHRFPFVRRRTRWANGTRVCHEQLMIGNTVVYTLDIVLRRCGGTP